MAAGAAPHQDRRHTIRIIGLCAPGRCLCPTTPPENHSYHKPHHYTHEHTLKDILFYET